MKLKGKIETHYNVKFNFDDNFLFYPFAENSNNMKFEHLIFNDY